MPLSPPRCARLFRSILPYGLLLAVFLVSASPVLADQPPVTTATPAAGMYGPAQSVSLACTDDVACIGTWYCLGSGCDPATPYTGPVTISSATDLRFYSTDTAGNRESTRTASYSFDAVQPVTSASPGSGTYSGQHQVTLTCSDTGTGCNGTFYCVGTGCTPNTLYSTPLTIPASTDLRYFSVDRAGNSEAVKTGSYTILPDSAAPTTTSNPGGGIYGQSWVSLSCTDGDGSGCASTWYCLGSGCTPSTLYNGSSVSIKSSTDLRFYSQDRSGNNETVRTVSYVIDGTPPVTSANPPGGNYQVPPSVTLSCSDVSGTGCQYTYYCKGANCIPTTQYNGPIVVDGGTVLRFYSVDAASNRETVVTQSYGNPNPPKNIAVPGEYGTIQAAIDAAYSGDTVVVGPGTYRESINFKGKNITVRSSDGPAVTIIDANQSATVVTFASGETRAAVLDGFSVTNGYSDQAGGGILAYYASPTIINNRIFGNSGQWGGGIDVSNSSASIRNNVISNNSSSAIGGGLAIGGSAAAEVTGNLISGNSASQGGGISLWSAGTPTISGNTITRNKAWSGGGIYTVNGAQALIVQNVIAENTGGQGSELYLSIPSGDPGPYLLNNTIVDSDSSTTGSLIYTTGFSSHSRWTNNVLAATGTRDAIFCDRTFSTVPPVFSHNVVYSKAGTSYGGACSDQNGVNGNLTADPLLFSIQGGRYGVQAGSPAVDAGDGSAASLPQADMDGLPRVVDGNGDGTTAVDAGAFEFDPARPLAQLGGLPEGVITSGSLTLTVSGTGVVSYRYSLDGAAFSADSPVATPISLAGLATGRHAITVLGKDAAGHEQAPSTAAFGSWLVDTQPSDLAFTFGGAAPWFQQGDVSRDGIAYQSGAVSAGQSSWMQTTVNGPGAIRFWWNFSGPPGSLQFTIDGSSQGIIYQPGWQQQAFQVPAGSHTLRWTYIAGTSSGTGPIQGWVDQLVFQPGSNPDLTPPVTTAAPEGGLFASSQQVTLSCTDNVGCTGTWYCLGINCTPSIPYSGPVTVSAAGYLRFFSTDAAGNQEPAKYIRLDFDTTAPSTFPSPPAGTYSGNRSVSLSCSDSGMGCNGTWYCLGSGCTPDTPYASGSPIPVTASTDLRFYSVDRGGNAEAVRTASYTIYPDVTAPVTGASYPSGAYGPITVYLSCYDGLGSGCATTYYCLGTGCQPTTAFSGYLTIGSSTDLRFYSVDGSGNNEAIHTVSYTIDSVPPSTALSTGGGVYQAPQTVALTCGDGSGSGCARSYYCLGKGCNPSTTYLAPLAIPSSTYLRYYSVDLAGNQEPTRTARYSIVSGSPATIEVPAGQPTIQAGIDAAKDGDTVVVAPGSYQENIDFKGKAITLKSSGGAAATIIDGSQAGAVVTFQSGEWLTSVLDGFTVRNGNTTLSGSGLGGGISATDSSPTIRNNSVVSNRGCYGAGIGAQYGAPLIQGNLISGNTQSCSSSYGGGGVYLATGTGAQVIGNTITGNRMDNSGGGIYATSQARLLISGNLIRGNGSSQATGVTSGGGIALTGCTETLLVQNVIADNLAANGSAIYNGGWSSWSLVNNTISDTVNPGGTLVAGDASQATVVNNIFYASTPLTLLDSACLNGVSPAGFSHNLVWAPAGSSYANSCFDPNGANGNLAADPKLSGPAFGFFGLTPGSPAIDAGDSGAAALPATDLAGAARVIAGLPQGTALVDLGAYEYDPGQPRATLSGGMPVTREPAATFTVGGDGIVSYRYAVDGGAFSSTDSAVSTPISVSGLAGGLHAVAVIGKSASGEQPVNSATVFQWDIDNLAPVTTAAPASGSYSTGQSVTLTCSDGAGSGCAGTFYCLGGGCTPTTPYTGAIPITSSTGIRFYSVDAFGLQEPVRTASYTLVTAISGRITEQGSGAAISYAYVTAFNAATGSVAGYGYTDSTGSYNITGLATGNYKLLFNASGYAQQWYSGKSDRTSADIVAVSAPDSVSGIDVALVKGGGISGTVTDPVSGAGIAYVAVSVINAATSSAVAYGSSLADGSYQIPALAPGDYKIQFFPQSSSGYLPQWYKNQPDQASAATVTVVAGLTSGGISVILQKGGSVSGTVTDSATGAPIAGVMVVAFDASGSFFQSASTDATGAYTLVGMNGSYKLNFWGGDYLQGWYGGDSRQTATSLTVAAQTATTGINKALTKGGSITGTITDSATGTVIPYAGVAAFDATSGEVAGYGSSDANGSYSITGLATGSYKVRFSGAGYLEQWSGGTGDQASAVAVAVTVLRSTSGVNAALVKGGSITGTVTDKRNGAPLAGVWITLYSQDRQWAWSAGTDSKGVYQVTGLPAGGYKIQASGGNGFAAQWYGGADQSSAATVTVAPPATVSGIDFSLQLGGSITGVVTDAATGAAIAGAQITAYDQASGQLIASASTDGSGIYYLTGLATGGYQLMFFANGYLTQWSGGSLSQASATAVPVSAPKATSAVNASLSAGGSISGTVTDRVSGVAIAGAFLYAIDSSSGDWVGSATTGSDGSYAITMLPTGHYRLRVVPGANSPYLGKWYGNQDGYLCGDTVSVTATKVTTFDFALDAGGSISGRVTDAATGQGIGAASLYWTDSTGRSVMGNLTMDATGSYTLAGLASGDYLLFFQATGYIAASAPVRATVSAPAVTEQVNAALSKGGGINGRVTDSSTGAGAANVQVWALDAVAGGVLSGDVTGVDGSYQIVGLPSGSYQISFDGTRAGEIIVTAASPGATGASSATGTSSTSVSVAAHAAVATSGPSYGRGVALDHSVSVTAPDVTSGIDFAIDEAGSISGRVTDRDDGSPVVMIYVKAYDSVTGQPVASSYSNSDGSYLLGGLNAGSYRLEFTGGNTANGGYLGAWYGGDTASVPGSEVVVNSPNTTTGIDMQLSKGGAISGVVTVSSCPAPHLVKVTAYDADSGQEISSTYVDTDYTARFTIGGLPAGGYKLAITPDAGFLRQWYANAADAAAAQTVTVRAGETTSVEIALSTGGGSISGRVTASGACPLTAGTLKLYNWDTGALVAQESTDYGTYQLGGIPDGSYRLQITANGLVSWYTAPAANPGDGYVIQSLPSATPSVIVVSGGTAVTGITLAESCPAPAPQPFVLLDAIKALKFTVGLLIPTPAELSQYDVTGNGKIEIDDALKILRWVVAPAGSN